MWAKHPEIAKRWAHEKGSKNKGLPMHVKKAAIERGFYDELEKLARDYKDEYAKFQASRDQKVDRAHRNKVRRHMLASGKVAKNDGQDIDHKDGNPRNNAEDNLAVTSKSYNRGKH